MSLRNKIIAGGLAVAALVATSAAAFAAPAYSTANVNVRSGPGTGYSVVDTLRRGEQVDVQQCRGSWCYVEKRGPDGWVSSNYLARGGNPGWDDDDYYDRPPVYNPRPPRPPQWNPRPPRPPQWNPRPPHYGYPSYGYPDRPGGSVCFNGPDGYVCIGN